MILPGNLLALQLWEWGNVRKAEGELDIVFGLLSRSKTMFGDGVLARKGIGKHPSVDKCLDY